MIFFNTTEVILEMSISPVHVYISTFLLYNLFAEKTKNKTTNANLTMEGLLEFIQSCMCFYTGR